jgi:hypothetical protein
MKLQISDFRIQINLQSEIYNLKSHCALTYFSGFSSNFRLHDAAQK